MGYSRILGQIIMRRESHSRISIMDMQNGSLGIRRSSSVQTRLLATGYDIFGLIRVASINRVTGSSQRPSTLCSAGIRKLLSAYVYLSDVSFREYGTNDSLEAAFMQCKWFTRGGTLQELIAPASVEFFSQEGQPLGDKRR